MACWLVNGSPKVIEWGKGTFGTSCLGSQPCGGTSGQGLAWGHHKFPTGAGGAVVGLSTLLPRELPPLSPSSHPKVSLCPSILLTAVPSPAKAARCSSASAPWAWGSSGTLTKTGLSPGSSGLHAPTLRCQVLLLLRQAQLAQDRAHQAMGRRKILGKSPGTSALPPRRAGKPHSLFPQLVVLYHRGDAAEMQAERRDVLLALVRSHHPEPRWLPPLTLGFFLLFAELPQNREANRCSSPASAPAGPPL